MMAVFFLLAAFFLGYIVVFFLEKKISEIEKVLLSFPIGLGLLSFIIFLISLVTNAVYSFQWIFTLSFLTTVSAGSLTYLLRKEHIHAGLERVRALRVPHSLAALRASFSRYALPILLLALSSIVLIYNLAWGTYDWDVVTLYDFRAQVLAQDRGLHQLYQMTGNDGDRFVYYFSYPFMTSISHAAMYLLHEQHVLVIYAFFYLSFYGLLYIHAQKLIQNSTIANGLFLLLLFLPTYFIQAQTAYSNFPYTVYLTFGMLYFFDSFRNKHLPFLPAVLIALSMWVRFVDPFYYIFLLLVIVFFVIHRNWKWLLAMLPIIFVRQVWGWYISTKVAPFSSSIEAFSLGALFKTFNGQILQRIAVVPEVLFFVEKILADILGVPLLILFIIITFKRKTIFKKYWLEISWIGLALLLIHMGSILFALVYKDWSGIPGSAERMFSSLLPILCLLAAVALNEFLAGGTSANENLKNQEIKLIKSTFYNEAETTQALQHFIGQAKMLSFGSECLKFEKSFAEFQGRKHAVFVNSGSSANLAMVQALLNMGKLKLRDKVGFSALTWSTNVMPILELGLTPVPIDVEINTLNISSAQLLKALKKTTMKAVFVTNLLGFCDDLDEIQEICRKKKIILLEDNCESMGSVYKGKKLGNFSLASSFSFYVGHHMSTVEGGMVCTDDENFAVMLRLVRAHGWDRNLTLGDQNKIRLKHKVNSTFYSRYTFYNLGYNLRPTEFAGFLGNYQMKFVNEIFQKRNQNFLQLAPAIYAQTKKYYPIKYDHMDFVSNFAVPVICKSRTLRDKLVKDCEGKVEIRPVVGGDMTQQPFFLQHTKKSQQTYKKTNAYLVHQQGLYFGNNPELTPDELNFLERIFTT